MIFDALVQRFRQRRKASFLAQADQFGDDFAFVGVGMHSIQNLYPVLQYLGIRLRWIYSRTGSNAASMAQRFPGAKSTADLAEIFRDSNVKNVFICVHPSKQAETVLKCIEAGKNCWVEKPLCRNLGELEGLIKLQDKKRVSVAVSQQKRFAPCYVKLKNKIRNPQSYRLAYAVGSYPEGDILSELFIHPLDLAIHLFGNVSDLQVSATGAKAERNFFIILKHESGVLGNLDLSASSDWRSARESMQVETEAGVYESENFRMLRYRERSKKVLGVPTEKLSDSAIAEKIIFSASGFLPEMAHNEIYLAGYYDSLRKFAASVSGGSEPVFPQPKDLVQVYKLLDKVREKTG